MLGGGLHIVNSTTKERAEEILGELTDEEFAVEVFKSIPAGASEVSVVPDDWPNGPRMFRGAWRKQGGAFWVDMAHARDIWRNHMRNERASLLRALDVEYIRADELGSAAVKADVIARKQALRDVTDDPAIEAAQTPDDLRKVWPAVLPPRRE